jgi:hypothetical protein
VEDKEPKGRKRGISDDAESSDEEKEAGDDAVPLMNPDNVKASDEFEYNGTARASHKKFVDFHICTVQGKKGGRIRIVCSPLSINALKVVSLVKTTDS